MVEATFSGHLQPSLLDRLVDNLYGIERERSHLQKQVRDRLSDEQVKKLSEIIEEEQRSHQHFDEAILSGFENLDDDGTEIISRLIAIEKQRYFEMRQNYVISMNRLRELVLRDLKELFNIESFDCIVPLDDFPNVRSSVVKFGIPALAGNVASMIDAETLARRIRDAIRSFEPRIGHDSVKVRIDVDREDMGQNTLALEIEGELWGDPMPLRLLLRTLIDLENGTAIVEDQAA